MQWVGSTGTTIYVGTLYEKNVSTAVETSYYFAGSQRVAMRQSGVLYYFAADHLGSTSLTMDASGNSQGTMGYKPFGETRYGSTPTDRKFTGQRQEDSSLGSLYDYGARFYSPYLNRWIQPDTIVPDPKNPQSLNRYAYVLNNPLRFVDPTGHYEDDALKAYLQRTYGDKWSDYWNNWTADTGWMNLLHNAESGDILSRVTASSGGMAQIDNFQFAGAGRGFLAGIARLDKMGGQIGNSDAGLNEIYSNMGENSGIGAFGFADNGDVVVRGTVGNITMTDHKYLRDELRYRDIVLQFGMPFVLGIAYFWLGAGVGFGEAAGNQEISNLPGNQAGDQDLTVGSFYPSGAPDSYYGVPIAPGNRSGYVYTFRNGHMISQNGYSQNVYVPHRR